MRNYLLKYRKQKNATQQFVANGLNCSQQYYAMIENGLRKQDMAYSMMEKLAEVFGVSVDVIISYETDYRKSIENRA